MNLSEVMTTKGLSNESLAKKSGMPASRIAAYRSGGRTMGWGTAIDLARALDFDATPAEIAGGNQRKALKRAAQKGDAGGVLRVAKSILTTAQKSGVEDEDGTLDELTDFAVKFAQEHGGPFAADDHVSFDGRDRMGRRVEPLDPDDEDEDLLGGDLFGFAEEGRDSRGVPRRKVR